MTLLIGDPVVAAIPVRDGGEPLVALTPDLTLGERGGVLVRAGIAARLEHAARSLPTGVGLAVIDGFRPPADQLAIIASYEADLRRRDPLLQGAALDRMVSRHVAPLATAPHVAGAAVDLTLTVDGVPVWMGSDVDATPEQSEGACYTDAPDLDVVVCNRRALMGVALRAAGFVNYPTEWWHWSHGDRYWAVVTGAPHALYGPVEPALAGAST